MPPPAARPRTSSYSGAAGGGSASKQKQRKPPTVRTGGAGGGGASGGGSSAVRLGAPPYSAAGLEARLAVADIPELANMLSAISRKERRLVGGGVFWSCCSEACFLAVSFEAAGCPCGLLCGCFAGLFGLKTTAAGRVVSGL